MAEMLTHDKNDILLWVSLMLVRNSDHSFCNASVNLTRSAPLDSFIDSIFVMYNSTLSSA